MNIGFIGTGEISKAVILGILGTNLSIKKIYISRRNKKISNYLKEKSKNSYFKNNQEIVDRSKLILVVTLK